MQKYFEKIKERLEKQKENSSYITDGIANRRIYDNGIKNAIEIVNNVAEECKDRIFINGQCCWQSCACTEKCQECNRYTLGDADIDWYESIEAWDDEFGKDTNVPSNDGWIPCDIKTPYFEIFECRKIWVTMRKKGHKFCFSRQLRWNGYDGRWEWDNGKNVSDEYEILAWKPLDIPAPYQPKGE